MGFERCVPHLNLPDPDDRHVLAAAIVAKCDLLITQNIRHFPVEYLSTFGIRASNPDDFLAALLLSNPDKSCASVNKILSRLIAPAYTFDQYLAQLGKNGLYQTTHDPGAISTFIHVAACCIPNLLAFIFNKREFSPIVGIHQLQITIKATTIMTKLNLPPGVDIRGEIRPEYEAILSAEACAFLAELARRFTAPPRRADAAARTAPSPNRQRRPARFPAGDGRYPRRPQLARRACAGGPARPRVEITGPTDRKMVINALNCGAKVFMADCEDANSPTWDNMVGGRSTCATPLMDRSLSPIPMAVFISSMSRRRR